MKAIDRRNYDPMKDIELVGLLTEEEVYNGANIYRCARPKHVKTLLEELHILPIPPGEPQSYWADMWVEKAEWPYQVFGRSRY